MSRTREALAKAIKRVDNRPDESVQELIDRWLTGVYVHQSWHDHTEVLVLLIALLQEKSKS